MVLSNYVAYFVLRLVCKTEDLEQRQKYAKAILADLTDCCKNKSRRSQKTDAAKKKEKEKEVETIAKKIISKMPPTIQVFYVYIFFCFVVEIRL